MPGTRPGMTEQDARLLGDSEVISLLVMEGDGIGPEICGATLNVLRAADRRFELKLGFTTTTIGFAALKAQGTTCPDAAIAAAKAADGVSLGPVSHNEYP